MSSETTVEGRYRFVVRMCVDTSCVWKNVTHTGKLQAPFAGLLSPWTSVPAGSFAAVSADDG